MREAPKSNLMMFVGHVIAILTVSIWALLAPVYTVSTSMGEVNVLTANGWVGDASAAWVLNTTNSSDYPAILWALVIAIAGSLILLVTVAVQRKVISGAWEILSLLAWVPVVVTCLFLGVDGFPMPAFTATHASLGVTVSAGWTISLWTQVIGACITLGATVTTRYLPEKDEPPALAQPLLINDARFRRLQAELVIRQSDAGDDKRVQEPAY